MSARGSSRGTDPEKVRLFIGSGRESINNMLSAVEDVAAADPTVADQARDDYQQCMKYIASTSVDGGLKVELNEIGDQLAELLEIWDSDQTQEETNASPKESELERQRREKEEEERKKKEEREKQRDEARSKMEELRKKRKEEMEMKLLQGELEKMKIIREQEEERRKKHAELKKVIDAQQGELGKLKREIEAAKSKEETLDDLQKQLVAAQSGTGGDVQIDEDKIRHELDRTEGLKIHELERATRDVESKADDDVAQLKLDDEDAFNVKKREVEEDFKANMSEETVTEAERAAIADMVRREYEPRKESLLAKIADAENDDNRPMAADECELELGRLKRLYEKEQEARKKLYNELVDMKGSIRVYVRVRPMFEKDKAHRGGTEAVEFPDFCTINVLGDDSKKAKAFKFDLVFPPGTAQLTVFNDTLPIITSVIDGYNCCIFAYGQTGSGKTWTMNGIPTDPGVMRRSITELFRLIQERSATEECTVSAAVLEIYNDMIRDLLVPKNAQKKYTIKSDPLAGQYVENLSYRPVTQPDDIDGCMSMAEKTRTANATAMNAQSSRSHMILYIVVTIQNKQTHSKIVSKLSLIDLAGSERIAKSGVEGQALKEAQHINMSLSSLGDVISSLGGKGKNKHIPYRNSSLTHLLQDSLGGQAKTLMFANCSPLSGDYQETISTLEFANRTRGVQLGKAKKNVSAA